VQVLDAEQGLHLGDEVVRDGEPQTFRMRLTQIWLRTGDGWVCLAGHAGPTSVSAQR